MVTNYMTVDQSEGQIRIGMQTPEGKLEINGVVLGDALRFAGLVLTAAGDAIHFREYGPPRVQK
jgi:hypothetical protein